MLDLVARHDLRLLEDLQSVHAFVVLVAHQKDLAERAAAEDVPIFVAGAGGREADYESVKQYRALGIIPLPAVSPIAAYVKLSIAAAYRMEIPAVMAKNCAGEYAE